MIVTTSGEGGRGAGGCKPYVVRPDVWMLTGTLRQECSNSERSLTYSRK